MTKLISPSCPAQDCPLHHRCYRYAPQDYDSWVEDMHSFATREEIMLGHLLIKAVRRQAAARWVATTCEFFEETRATITVEPLVTCVN